MRNEHEYDLKADNLGKTDAAAPVPATARISDDILAILCGGLLLAVSFAVVWFGSSWKTDKEGQVVFVPHNGLAEWVGEPGKWRENPLTAFVKESRSDTSSAVQLDWSSSIGTAGAFAILAFLLTMAVRLRDGQGRGLPFLVGFAGVFLLATLAFTLAGQSVVKAYNLEYALWALLIGLLISNTIGAPSFLRPAMRTEFFIKTGLVLFGAEVLMSRLLALGLPGVFVAWIVTPIVLISTYIFGQKVLKMESRSLNMVISADMSVCGVSAAIAAASACKAKKEELSLAIGMSLSFTVIMMIVMPILIKLIGMNEIVGGAWIGGTIDSTGAVVAAAATLGKEAADVAATVKMIQNILIGVTAFGIASYWVTCVEKDPHGKRPHVSEIWIRFPKFVLGFVGASIIFSLIHSCVSGGPELVSSMIGGSTKFFRGWFFCLAFVSIGLETRFRDLAAYLKGGKPLMLYVCGQTLNLVLTLLMAWLMFGVLFKDSF